MHAYDMHLPVAAHVSRREVRKYLDERAQAHERTRAHFHGMVGRLLSRFCQGRRLETSAVETILREASEGLAGDAHLLRTVRALPSRAKPRAMSGEMLATVTLPDTDSVEVSWSLMALRLYVDRKRAEYDQEHLGISYTRHAMERALERDMVPVQGGQLAFDTAIHGYQGVVAAWRLAMSRGMLPAGHDLHLPFQGGLLLGSYLAIHKYATGLRHRIDAVGCQHGEIGTTPLRVLGTAEGPAVATWVARTVVSFEMLNRQQDSYANEMLDHLDRHAAAYDAVAETGAWTDPAMVAGFDGAGLSAAMDAATRDLVRIVRDRRHRWVHLDRTHRETNPRYMAA